MNNYYDCDRDEIIFDNCVFFSLYKTESEYLMLMRHRISNENPNVNPSVFNTTYIMRYDTNMNKQNNTQLIDTNRPTHRSYTTGIEDSRFIDDKSFLCVCCDSNPFWKPEMCYVSFSLDTSTVEKLTPLYIEGIPRKTEKNWLFLKRYSDTQIDMLYWCNPFKIVRADIITGSTRIIKEFSVEGITLNAHGGASIFLEPGTVPVEYENKYLVSIRLFELKPNWPCETYTHSQWILLDSEYNFIGISTPYKWDHDKSYEINTSLHIKDDILLATVVLNETNKYIYKLDMNDIFESIEMFNGVKSLSNA